MPRLACLTTPTKPSTSTSTATTPNGAISSFASLDEQIAHLHWRKTCNERQIQGSLRRTKQLQERDELQRAAVDVISCADAAATGTVSQRREWMHAVIQHELSQPLPVTAFEMDALAAQLQRDELRAQRSAQTHMQQIGAIQRKLDAREAQVVRKRAFEHKRSELFAVER